MKLTKDRLLKYLVLIGTGAVAGSVLGWLMGCGSGDG